MTEDQIDEAARMWRRRIDTQTIARLMKLRECDVYNHLWRIRLRAMDRKSA
jgi:hypothetical protein